MSTITSTRVYYTLIDLLDNTLRFKTYEEAKCFNDKHYEGEYTIRRVIDTHDQKYSLFFEHDLEERRGHTSGYKVSYHYPKYMSGVGVVTRTVND